MVFAPKKGKMGNRGSDFPNNGIHTQLQSSIHWILSKSGMKDKWGRGSGDLHAVGVRGIEVPREGRDSFPLLVPCSPLSPKMIKSGDVEEGLLFYSTSTSAKGEGLPGREEHITLTPSQMGRDTPFAWALSQLPLGKAARWTCTLNIVLIEIVAFNTFAMKG